jgi:hypothetical protein
MAGIVSAITLAVLFVFRHPLLTWRTVREDLAKMREDL